MKDRENVAAEGTAAHGKSAREHNPSQPSAAAQPAVHGPVSITDLDAERIRTACLTLMSLADELGLGGTRIMIHNLTEASAFEVFPGGEKFELTNRSATWDFRNGDHTVYLFVPQVIGEAA